MFTVPAVRSFKTILILVFSPFCPHFCEEMWQELGHDTACCDTPWPSYDESALAEDTVEIIVQFNGKLKAKMKVEADISREDMQKEVENDETVKGLLEGKTVVKVIAIPGKLVNFVVR